MESKNKFPKELEGIISPEKLAAVKRLVEEMAE